MSPEQSAAVPWSAIGDYMEAAFSLAICVLSGAGEGSEEKE